MQEEVTIEKLVHGGQGLATMADGQKVFVWGALPGEKAKIRIIKKKRSYAEAIAEQIVQPSPVRVQEREENYLATSPWQIVDFAAENEYKKRIVQELFVQAHVPIADDFAMTSAGDEWHYRNKMEYSFWGDDDGLHLALHNRGSHHKTIVQGSELALSALDAGAQAVLAELQKYNPRAGDLKTIIVRCSQKGDVVVSLFTKREDFHKIQLPAEVKGMNVYFSNPKSPASVPTKLLYSLGDVTLTDTLLGTEFTYDADSFFQVNIPVFEAALSRIQEHGATDNLVDMYAGVGSIGLSVAKQRVELVEADAATAAMARVNAQKSGVNAEVVESPSEKVLDYIVPDKTIIFDPPRAGLHDKIVQKTLEALPPKVIYLSCNPATQARDLALLQEAYNITYFEGFNFFPHTPHIETLAVLTKK
ncbi:MAG TPA: TRAM domain-containing protein [Candidatus Saccharimonadales bacterium]|nr:TRAM domain-containing protein [Candidatus Saccharimonadales bacterium]